MKSLAYPASRMNPMYQPRKKIVAGTTKRRLAATSSRNSGDCSAATQSIWGGSGDTSCMALLLKEVRINDRLVRPGRLTPDHQRVPSARETDTPD